MATMVVVVQYVGGGRSGSGGSSGNVTSRQHHANDNCNDSQQSLQLGTQQKPHDTLHVA